MHAAHHHQSSYNRHSSYNLWKLYAAQHVFSQQQQQFEQATRSTETEQRSTSGSSSAAPTGDTPLTAAYKALGCRPYSTDDQVKSAFRRLAKEWHPDLSQHPRELSTRMFRHIRTAYETILTARASA